MQTSDELDKIAPALAKALQGVQNATKNSENPHFRSKYADLTEVLETAKPALMAEGIVVVQGPGWDGQCVTLTTRLLHSSGQWIETTAGSPIPKADPQGVGSAITYLRRYGLAAMVGMGQEDDDGNSASQRRDSAGQPHRRASQATHSASASSEEIACPACSGPMWDNRSDEKAAINGGKRPDLKCRDKECDTAIWMGSVRDDLKASLEHATQADILTDAERTRVAGVIDGYKEQPAGLLAALDWIREKMMSTQGAA